MSRYYSNGKLLLTGEYLVLDGAKSLAVPSKFGQDLVVEPMNDSQLIWSSFTEKGECWFEAIFDLPKLRLLSASFNSENEGSAEFIAETLLEVLQEARNLNPDFLSSHPGYMVKTNLTFPRNWGLGTSSTLINNVAKWANIDPFQLLNKTFSGSGYDIANAQYDFPIFYTLKDQKPVIEKANFNPSFKDQLYFVYLNRKQNSREGIKRYKERRGKIFSELDIISTIADELIGVQSLEDFEKLIAEHEKIISSIIELPPVKDEFFSDYFGMVKSLGAWGGDFVLVTGNIDTPKYFNQKGYSTILSYSEMIL